MLFAMVAILSIYAVPLCLIASLLTVILAARKR